MINLFINLQINLFCIKYIIKKNNNNITMTRKSPNDHAKKFQDYIKFGNNNNLWVSKPDINKVYKWKELKPSYDIYKIYSIIKKENKNIQTRYKNMIMLLKQLSKKINLEHTKFFISNLEHLVESFDNKYKSNDYLGDNGFYGRYMVDDELKKIISSKNIDHSFIINDIDLYMYLETKKLFLFGIYTDKTIIKNIKQLILDIFKKFKVKFIISKRFNTCLVEITDL